MEQLEEIIEAEGPVVLNRVFHLYAGAAGIKRVGNQLRKLFLRTSEAAIKSGRIEDEQGRQKLSLDSVVRRAGIQRVLLRKRGPRDFEEIPPSEIAELYRSIGAAHFATDKTTLYRQILDFYDLKRLTSNVRRSLDQIASEAD